MPPRLRVSLLSSCATLLAGLVLFFSFSSAANADDGVVKAPAVVWEDMLDELDVADDPVAPPAVVLHLDRQLSGTFRKGVITVSLLTTFEVPSVDDAVRVPVLDSDTSAQRVLLDGRPTSLLQEGDVYTVGVAEPGRHVVEVSFVHGREDDRFARRLAFALPPSGPTQLSVWVPEADIDASLEHGAVVREVVARGGTRIDGYLDGLGEVDLSWKRRVTHAEAATAVRAEARLDTLFTLHEALVRGVASLELSVLDGETDQVALVLPADIEVVDVTGDAVLQWRTELPEAEGSDGRLVVLLRYLVDDRVNVQVHFQFPVDLEAQASVPLRMPVPLADVPTRGAIGVQGPAGLEVSVARAERAEALTVRDLPPELTEMTRNPLLMGFRFMEPPDVALTLSRNAEVELTSTIVDDIQASSVLIEDGTEITKIRLRMRNNTRQYLEARLPEGAVLTHAFIDGQALRPARKGDGTALLFPLRQSKRIEGSQVRTHMVMTGDTLMGIAERYLGNSGRWTAILAANSDQISASRELQPGQVLRIPGTGSMEESSFVIELAYKVPGDRLGSLGRRAVTLPTLDVDAVSIHWNLYVPAALTPLDFKANLTQTSAIRYDLFRRAKHFWKRAFRVHSAWAGGYSSILSQRKTIYDQENTRRSGGMEVTSDFPFTGKKYEFKRILLGQDTPQVTVAYLTREALSPLRLGALLFAFALMTATLRAEGRGRWVGLGLGVAALLVVAHFVLGVHRRVLWGLDVAIALDLVRTHGGRAVELARERIRTPRMLVEILSWRNVFGVGTLAFGMLVLGAVPLFLSSAALVALLIARRSLR